MLFGAYQHTTDIYSHGVCWPGDTSRDREEETACMSSSQGTRQNQQNRERKSSEREPRWRGPKAKQEVQGGLIQLSPMHEQVKEDEV